MQRRMDCVNRDMRAIQTTEHKVHDRTDRRIVSAVATAQKVGALEKKKKLSECYFIITPHLHSPG